MTDRFNALIVVLEHDLRDEDAKATIAAIEQIRGVLSVKGNVRDASSHVAQERVRHELGERLLAVLHPKASGQ